MRAVTVVSINVCLGLQLLFFSNEARASSARHLDLAPETITILVTNDSVVTPPILQAAEDVASHIFLDARIEIHWTEEITASPLFSVIMRTGEDHDRYGAFSSDGPFARTLRTRHVLGGRTSVFYDRIVEQALAKQRSLAGLLGTVMAHEIGHMLLPDMVHSTNGLMRSGWDDEDLMHAQVGALRLTREQVDQIHARLALARARSAAGERDLNAPRDRSAALRIRQPQRLVEASRALARGRQQTALMIQLRQPPPIIAIARHRYRSVEDCDGDRAIAT
jgi:hypothetical protein